MRVAVDGDRIQPAKAGGRTCDSSLPGSKRKRTRSTVHVSGVVLLGGFFSIGNLLLYCTVYTVASYAGCQEGTSPCASIGRSSGGMTNCSTVLLRRTLNWWLPVDGQIIGSIWMPACREG